MSSDGFFFIVSFIFTIVPIIFIISIVAIIFSTRGKKAQKVSRTYHQQRTSTVNGVHNSTFSHENLHEYSTQYANANSVKDSGIKDKPMSEAERNVFYGK